MSKTINELNEEINDLRANLRELREMITALQVAQIKDDWAHDLSQQQDLPRSFNFEPTPKMGWYPVRPSWWDSNEETALNDFDAGGESTNEAVE